MAMLVVVMMVGGISNKEVSGSSSSHDGISSGGGISNSDIGEGSSSGDGRRRRGNSDSSN